VRFFTLRRGIAPARFRRLEIEQQGRQVHISLQLDRGWSASDLQARAADERLLPLARFSKVGDATYTCDFDLGAPAVAEFAKGSASVLTVLVERAAGTDPVRHRKDLGRADRTLLTGLGPTASGRSFVSLYSNRHGCLALRAKRTLPGYGFVYVRRLKLRKGVARLSGRVNTRHGDVTGADLVLKGRVTHARMTQPIELRFLQRRSLRRFGHRWYSYRAAFDFRTVLAQPGAVDDIYDAYLHLVTAQTPGGHEVRIGRTPLVARVLTRPGWAVRGPQALAITPIYTYKTHFTSFRIARFPTTAMRYLRRQLRFRLLIRTLNQSDVWLVGERPDTAQDNGYWFFRYLREHHPEIEAYYVIRDDSPARARLEPLGNVISFGSREHIRLSLLATRIFCTHHPDYLFPLRTPAVKRAMAGAVRVFLQHGVMGTKWMASLYGKPLAGFDVDLFIVSSDREKHYIVSDFGYDPAEVAVTGLARFDSLFAGDVARNPRQLLIMPTWREWLLDVDTYTESEFFRTWSELLRDPRLHRVIEQSGLSVVFCLHTNMAQYREQFADLPVEVVSQSEVDVQQLLKQSAMLVTDYSSVGFDFSFLHRPVAYFQFDRERFLGPSGSHLDLDAELPGPVLRNAGDVIEEIRARASAGFAPAPEYVGRADRFCAFRDRSNSERIFAAAQSARRSRTLRRRLAKHPVAGVARRMLDPAHPPAIVRRQRFYLPAMRVVYALSRRLPMRRDLVFFESNNGRDYADSPRYIYEELVRTRPDLRTVWVHDHRLPSANPATTVVSRLSPAYFYHLGRARFWVNNYNYPPYVTRRPAATFVQTWHGTPLKRRLHDTSAEHWSVLVSPNSYTTDVVRSACSYRGPVLELGYPRNDPLHDPRRDQLTVRLRHSLGLAAARQVILYAPAPRDRPGTGAQIAAALPLHLERLTTELGDDVVLLLRMHSRMQQRIVIAPRLRDVVRDVTRYPEMQELLLISDVLVTDYSSVFFDFAALDRPMVFYAYDLDTYRDQAGGFHLDYEQEVPGPIVHTEDALWAELRRAGSRPGDAPREFLQRFAPRDDGHASQRVVHAVFGEH
jgi:CDP-glycerol glycerophosphotransferase